jgi:hypothetical protein
MFLAVLRFAGVWLLLILNHTGFIWTRSWSPPVSLGFRWSSFLPFPVIALAIGHVLSWNLPGLAKHTLVWLKLRRMRRHHSRQFIGIVGTTRTVSRSWVRSCGRAFAHSAWIIWLVVCSSKFRMVSFHVFRRFIALVITFFRMRATLANPTAFWDTSSSTDFK